MCVEMDECKYLERFEECFLHGQSTIFCKELLKKTKNTQTNP